MNAKYETAPDSPDYNMVSRKVLKIWDENGYEIDLPKEVTVDLLKDGEVFDTVTLNADNLWRYTWEELDAGCNWSVVEREMKDYSVSVTREGITFVITNTYNPDDPDPKPTPTPTPPPDKPPEDPKLPQTGQLWWPVPMLVCAGMLLIIIGLLRRRRG